MQSRAWAGNWPESQWFGVNPSRYVGFGVAGHNGLDIAMPWGTELYAPFDGTVIEVGNDPLGYGLYLKLLGTEEQHWLSAHLSDQYQTREGDLVVAGTPWGRSGSTGNSTGPHLHIAYRPLAWLRAWPFNGYVDPRPFLLRAGA